MKSISTHPKYHALVLSLLCLFTLLVLSVNPASTKALEIGQKSPEFKALDLQGKSHLLSDYKGKMVVLEWSSPKCPYVKKHYKNKNMQAVQKQALADNDLVWLTILSSAKETPAYVKPKKAETIYRQKYNSQASYILMDTKGDIGRLYHTKVTPHMYLINKDGVLVYQGAIDDKPSTRKSSLKNAKNYILEALSELKQNKKITKPNTIAYGCAVYY